MFPWALSLFSSLPKGSTGGGGSKAEILKSRGQPVVPPSPRSLCLIPAGKGTSTHSAFWPLSTKVPQESLVLPFVETSLWRRNKSSTVAQRSRRSSGFSHLPCVCFMLSSRSLAEPAKEAEAVDTGHSRGRLPSSSLKPIQLKWQKQIAVIFKPVWGTSYDSTENLQLKFQTEVGCGAGGTATEQAKLLHCIHWKADTLLKLIFGGKKIYQCILYFLLESIWRILTGFLLLLFSYLGKEKAILIEWLNDLGFLKQGLK